MKSKSPCCPARPATLAAAPGHVEAFKALAHLDRLRVFIHLVQAGRPVAVNEIQAAVEVPAPTLSRHLDQLERCGLIERRRQERFILSSVRRDLVVELVRMLTACC